MICIKCDKEFSHVYLYSSKDRLKKSICNVCYDKLINENEYSNAKEELIKEFSKFMFLADKAELTNTNKLPLKVRKQSIYIRELLKNFRQVSLNNEKKLNG